MKALNLLYKSCIQIELIGWEMVEFWVWKMKLLRTPKTISLEQKFIKAQPHWINLFERWIWSFNKLIKQPSKRHKKELLFWCDSHTFFEVFSKIFSSFIDHFSFIYLKTLTDWDEILYINIFEICKMKRSRLMYLNDIMWCNRRRRCLNRNMMILNSL